MKTAQPIYVSCWKEVFDNAGHYTGETSVIINVNGNCMYRVCLGVTGLKPPVAPHGGYVYHINYMSDVNISVIEYRFQNTWLRDREKISEKFRQKMLKKVNKQKIKDYIAQLEGNTGWIVVPKLKLWHR